MLGLSLGRRLVESSHSGHHSQPSSAIRIEQGDDTRLRRLRLIGIALPVIFVTAAELIRLTIVHPLWPHWGHLVLGTLIVLAATGFGVTIFSFINRAHRLVLGQNRQLAAVNAVSTAVSQDLGVDQVVDAALKSVLAATGARRVKIAASIPMDRLPYEDVTDWCRVATADGGAGEWTTSPRTVEIPLLAGTGVVGTMSLQFESGAGCPDGLASDVLRNIGQHVGSAIQRAQLIADLLRREREGQAFYRVLLQISSQSSPATTLVSIVNLARDLLGADEAGLCLNWSTAGVVSIDTGARGACALDGLVCITGEDSQMGDNRSPTWTCPMLRVGHYPAFVSVPLRGPAGWLGQIWVARRSGRPFSRRGERFLDTLSELTVVAVNHARMLEYECQGAILAERERIAREMHDSLAQVLGVTQLRLRALSARPELAEAATVRDELTDLAGICQEAYHDVREAILGLRESSRTDRTLLESLCAYVEKFSRQSGIETTLDSAIKSELTLLPQCEVQVIRVIQEALTNVRKHSGARSAVVRISETPESTVFVVEDDGHGFDPGAVPDDREGFGLHSMRERIKLINGQLTIDSTPGQGTRVIVRVPASHQVLPPVPAAADDRSVIVQSRRPSPDETSLRPAREVVQA